MTTTTTAPRNDYVARYALAAAEVGYYARIVANAADAIAVAARAPYYDYAYARENAAYVANMFALLTSTVLASEAAYRTASDACLGRLD